MKYEESATNDQQPVYKKYAQLHILLWTDL